MVRIAHGLVHEHSLPPGKANIIIDGLRRLSISSTFHLEEEKKEQENYVHIIAHLEVRIMDSTKKRIVEKMGLNRHYCQK